MLCDTSAERALKRQRLMEAFGVAAPQPPPQDASPHPDTPICGLATCSSPPGHHYGENGHYATHPPRRAVDHPMHPMHAIYAMRTAESTDNVEPFPCKHAGLLREYGGVHQYMRMLRKEIPWPNQLRGEPPPSH